MMSSNGSPILIHEGKKSRIYYQQESEYNRPVIIKTLKNDIPSALDLIRLNNEYKITGDLAIDRVRRAIARMSMENRPALVMEYITGQTLKQAFVEQRQSLADILQAVIQIAQTLGEIHQNRIIHKDINSDNILINPETKEVKLIDFGLASRIDLPVHHLGNPELLDGNLSYISPEQTGRMNRTVDYRTDLYSLGVTFYEMLTGQLPFRSDDPLALVHAHMAKMPRPITALNPSVPPILADMVMKLLAKNAEDRYQSAFGLKADLERFLTTLTGSQDVQDVADLRFELGQDDYSGRLNIPQKLYGRSTEIATLMAAFDRVAAGSRELMLVAGYPGVGKSSLVAEVHKPITEKRGSFISGKFVQYLQNMPYAAFTQAFNQFAELLLTESDVILQQWRDKILSAVGSNGAVLTEVMPILEKIIGTQPPVPKLSGDENRNRFILTFQNFVQAISSAEHPLVIFIDDWQWADLASLELLKALLTGEAIAHVLLIGAYRNNEVNISHPFMMALDNLAAAGCAVRTIELDNLPGEDVVQLVRESLSGSPDESRALAELVYERTQGNAFFTRQFLQNLHEDDWLRFDFNTRRWTWDIVQLKAQQIIDSVVDLMGGKLRKLSSGTIKLLQLAACIGTEFNLKTLAVISQRAESTILELLSEVINEGLVIPLDNYYKLPDTAAQACFRFLHDRVQQAAYAQISASEREKVHLEIGRLLLENTTAEELERQVFGIVQHYNLAGPLVKTEAERLRVAELNMLAADLAYESAAFRSAQVYLETAMTLMPADAWNSKYDVMMRLHSQLATVLSLTGDTEQLEHIYQIVEKQAHTMSDTARVKMAKIQSLLYHGNYTDAIELGLTFVQAMGIPINRNPSPEEAFRYVQETDEWLTQARIDGLSHLPEAGTDVGQILEVATSINGPLYNSEMSLFLVFVSQIARLCIEHGLTPWSPVTIINLAMVLAAIVHDIPKVQLLTKTTMQLFEERYRSDIPISPLNLLIGGFILHRYDHLRKTLPVFVEGVQKGLTTGTFLYVGYCAWWQAWHLLFSGEPLSTVEAISQHAEETCEKTQAGRMKDWCLLIHQVTLNLQGKSEEPCILTGSVYDEQEKQAYSHQVHDSADVFRFFLYKAWLHYLFQNPRASVKLFRDTESYLLYGTGTYFVPLFYFYDTLANAAFFDLCASEERPEILKRIQRNLKEFEVWVRFAPMNHQHKKDLMNAEKARIEGRYWEAAAFYEKAIEGARENEFVNEEALACERAAEFYLSRGLEEIAHLYMTKAHYGYSRWQARAKVQDLEKRYKLWFSKTVPLHSEEGTTEHREKMSGLDLKSVMKASRAISGEIVLEELLKKLMEIVIENAGAQQGFLILEKEGKWFIKAEGTAGLQDVTTLREIEVEESDKACPSIIHYVAHSHKSVVLDDAANRGLFVDDLYIKRNQTKSVLCIPLLNRGRLSGILYLENNLATDTFTPERIEVLESLAGEAAIALENALLYQQAQHEIEERKAAAAALRESEQRFRTIFDSVNDAIFVQDLTTGQVLDVNRKMCEMYGYTREEALHVIIGDLSLGEPPYTQEDALAWMRKAAAGEPQLFEWRAKDKEGRLFWVEVNMRRAAIGGQDQLFVVVRDITERKQAEEALHESEARYHTLSDYYRELNDIFITFTEAQSVDDLFRIIANQYRIFTGATVTIATRYEKSDSSLTPVAVSGDTEVIDGMESALGDRLLGRRIPVGNGLTGLIMSRVVKRSGSLAELPTGALTQQASDRIHEAIGCKEVISLAIHYGPDLVGTAVALMPEHDTRIPDDTLITFGHMAGLAVTRKKAEEEIISLNLELEQKVLQRTEELRKAYDDIMRTNQDLENAMRDLKDAQHQLVQSEKLAALGQLVAGIAHELNTPLGAIISSNRSIIDLIQHKIPEAVDLLPTLKKSEFKSFKILMDESLEKSSIIETPPGRKIKKEIASILINAGIPDHTTVSELIMDTEVYGLREKLIDILKIERREEVLSSVAVLSSMRRLSEIVSLASEKVSHVVNALQNYLKQDADEEVTNVNIQKEIDTILTLYHNKIKQGVTITKKYGNHGPVRGERHRLNQLWMNLLNNALQAIDYRGAIEIETRRNDDWIVVSVTDSGPGIPEEVRERIFEPFFTTKMHGEGMGLGLDISRRIAEKHGGRIEFESVPGKTKFSVWLKAGEV